MQWMLVPDESQLGSLSKTWHQWGMHLHISHICLVNYVQHRKLQRLIGEYFSYLTQSVNKDLGLIFEIMLWYRVSILRRLITPYFTEWPLD